MAAIHHAGEHHIEQGSAVAQVFDTAELLEIILLKCPTATILTAQRVRRAWRATIMGSPKGAEDLVHASTRVQTTYCIAAHLIADLYTRRLRHRSFRRGLEDATVVFQTRNVDHEYIPPDYLPYRRRGRVRRPIFYALSE